MFNAKKRKIDELQARADVYGRKLTEHHDSQGSCDEARESWQGRNGSLSARVAELCHQVGERGVRIAELDDQVHEQALTIRGLVEENTTLKAAIGASSAPVESGATA